jgi:hypothetical protein
MNKSILLLMTFLMAIVFVSGCINSTTNSTTYTKPILDTKLGDIVRNSEKYEGQNVSVVGCISPSLYGWDLGDEGYVIPLKNAEEPGRDTWSLVCSNFVKVRVNGVVESGSLTVIQPIEYLGQFYPPNN